MKTFKDLKFEKLAFGGIQATEYFENGYGVSVIKTPFSYGGEKGLHELAVFLKAICAILPI